MTFCTNVLLFCMCYLCSRTMVVLARRDGAETRLQERTAGCMKSAGVMNNEHWSHGVYVMNSEVSTNGLWSDEVSSMSRLVVWRCLADSVLASSSAGRCDVSIDSPQCRWGFALLIYCDAIIIIIIRQLIRRRNMFIKSLQGRNIYVQFCVLVYFRQRIFAV